jgi:hypothetical protein
MLDQDNYRSYQPCIVCGTLSEQRCYHHVKSRGSGGSDHPCNMISVCQVHHNMFHNKGNKYMTYTFKGVQQWFQLNGWVETEAKWMAPREATR